MLVEQGALFILAYVTCVTADLELVHVVFRHGERTPADTYPNDPHINDTLEPVGWGQLTNQGKVDQYNQGCFLRQRYDSFLGDLYSPEVIRVQSTDVDRTKMSAQLEMAGLWPPAPAQLWRRSLKWQPIPIHAQPLNQDDLLLVRVKCLRYHEELQKVMGSDVVQAELATMSVDELYPELTELTGMPIRNPDDIQSLYSTLKAEVILYVGDSTDFSIKKLMPNACLHTAPKPGIYRGFGLSLPEWTDNYFPLALEQLTAYSFELNTYNKELQKLRGGPLLKKILTESKAKSEGSLTPAGRKMFVYAGHDSTVANLLRALQVWERQVPDYGIMALIELHREADDFHVRVFLRNSTTVEPYPLTLPGCAHKCPLSDFLALTADVVPGDLSEDCKPVDPSYTQVNTMAP